MRFLSFWLVPTLVIIIFSGCAKRDIPSSSGNYKAGDSAVAHVFYSGTAAINALLNYADTHDTDPATALNAIVDSIKQYPYVADAMIQDSLNLLIKLKNGMQTFLSIDFLNADGTSVVRGGEYGKQVLEFFGNEDSRQVAKNKNVLFYSPPFDEFYTGAMLNQDKVLEKIITGSGPDYTFTRITGYQSKPSVINTFKQYGMVIMSTHGYPWGYMVGRLQLPDFIRSIKTPNGTYQLKADSLRSEADFQQLISSNNEPGTYESLLKNELTIGFSIKLKLPLEKWIKQAHEFIGEYPPNRPNLFATTKYIEKANTFDSTIIFGNMCYGGATTNGSSFKTGKWSKIGEGFIGIRDALMSKKPGAYYCYISYSYPEGLRASNEMAISTEQLLTKSLIEEKDTTGNAYLTNEGNHIVIYEYGLNMGAESELNLFGANNIWFGCGNGQFTDARDGNVYKTVCINGKQWMAENLRFNATGSLVYNGNATYAAKYGRLYSWAIMMNGQAGSDKVPSGVQGICPKGWHVPSAGEFDEMIAALGGTAAGKQMRSTTDWIGNGNGTNTSGLNIFPAGFYNADDGYKPLGYVTYLRSATSTSNNGAFTYWMINTGNEMNKTNYSTNNVKGKPLYYSCRCAADY